MSAAENCQDLNEISEYLGFTPQHLFYLVEEPDKYYTTIKIPKNRDPTEYRQIDIPFSELKGVQKAILRKVLSQYPASDFAHSYVSGRSILTAAAKFCPGKSVLKVDIQNFFPSITTKRIIGLFRSLGFQGNVSFILARLCLKDGCLAQGAPTSPALSNLIVRKLDRQMSRLATTWELDYLRYSDDMFFYKSKNFNHHKLSSIAEAIVVQNCPSSGFLGLIAA